MNEEQPKEQETVCAESHCDQVVSFLRFTWESRDFGLPAHRNVP